MGETARISSEWLPLGSLMIPARDYLMSPLGKETVGLEIPPITATSPNEGASCRRLSGFLLLPTGQLPGFQGEHSLAHGGIPEVAWGFTQTDPAFYPSAF